MDPDIIPHPNIKPLSRCTRRLLRTNKLLQLKNWAWNRLVKTEGLFAGTVIDEETGK